MMRALLFGLLYQVVVAIGFIWIADVARATSPVVRANLMLSVAGIIAAAILVGFAFVRGDSISGTLSSSDVLHLSLGAVLILVVGESLYIAGLAASNATTMAYTALAFPAVCLFLDVALGRIPFASLTIQDYAGMFFLVVGFTLISSHANP